MSAGRGRLPRPYICRKSRKQSARGHRPYACVETRTRAARAGQGASGRSARRKVASKRVRPCMREGGLLVYELGVWRGHSSSCSASGRSPSSCTGQLGDHQGTTAGPTEIVGTHDRPVMRATCPARAPPGLIGSARVRSHICPNSDKSSSSPARGHTSARGHSIPASAQFSYWGASLMKLLLSASTSSCTWCTVSSLCAPCAQRDREGDVLTSRTPCGHPPCRSCRYAAALDQARSSR